MPKRISERLKRYEATLSGEPPLEVKAPEQLSRVIVIGHKNPDTDSVAAAAGYAQLKQQMGMSHAVAACAGLPSARTEFLFKKFNVPMPVVVARRCIRLPRAGRARSAGAGDP